MVDNRKNNFYTGNIALIGFMGCGKSTVSSALHKLYGMRVVEMDQEIVCQEGMSISDIFEKHGEAYFRELETQLLMRLQREERVVISCGGGVPMRERNVQEMRKNSVIVWLLASPETIYERVKDNHDRPLLEGNMNVTYIAQLMEQRREKYEAAADVKVITDGKCAEDICEEIMRQIRK